MIFRFTLSHEILGTLVISEPDGWLDAKIKLERHEEYHSVIEYFEGEFTFYGDNGQENGGIDFIREVEITYGFDAELGITIELSQDGFTYETIFIGQLDLSQLEELPDNKMQVPIIRNDFWSKFINRTETAVDVQAALNLDNQPAEQFDSINLRLTPQKIQQTSETASSIGYIFAKEDDDNLGAGEYLQFGLDDLTLDEIKERFGLPYSYNAVLPVWIYEVEFDGLYNIHARTETSVIENQPTLPPGNDFEFYVTRGAITPITAFYISINNDVYELDYTNYSSSRPWFNGVTTVSYTVLSSGAEKIITITLKKGDIIRFYGYVLNNWPVSDGKGRGILLWGNNNSEVVLDDMLSGSGTYDFETAASGEARPTFLDIVAQTVFTESNAQSFFLHDAAGQIIDRITGQDESFYSEILGSDQTVYRQYDADGCYWPYAIAKGLQIRRYSLIEKPFFLSFKQWWEGANPILNLGLGYETFDDHEVIRIENKRHFYDDSDTSVNINYVRDIVRKYDENRLFKTVKIGYKKWQSENISGIDDAQTKRTYATRLQKSGKDLTVESDFIAASLAIETTRRTTREKSADYKYDNDTFIIALRPFPIDISPETIPDVTDYEPELDENFTDISNLLNPETRYNLRLTPARNLIRWRDWLSAGLQAYPADPFKFTSGEGNYDMASDYLGASDGCDTELNDLSENQDITISENPFHLALLYEINCPLDWDDYVLIRDNRNMAIGISQTDENHVKFFIKDLEYSIAKGTLKITAWPVEFMSIEVIETPTQMRICEPVAGCVDALLSESSDELVTESNDCFILE